jgi:hypothetical protein
MSDCVFVMVDGDGLVDVGDCDVCAIGVGDDG